MRRDIAAIGATLAAAGLGLAGTGIIAAAATPQPAQASAALNYLYAQVGADGSVAGSMGTTEDTVISVADAGYDPATLRNAATGVSAYAYLAAHAASITTAGSAAKYVLAWLAAGRPAALHGHPVLTRLNTAAGGGGFVQANGAFHATDPNLETANAYSQSLAVLADRRAGVAAPAQATGWLLCAQRPDGGFGYLIHDAAATPPAACGDTASDSNDTAIVLQALALSRLSAADAAATAYLGSVQQSGGGFAFNTTGPSDPDSDTAVIQALVAIHQDPTGPAWSAKGSNPLADLESFASTGGGYAFVHGAAPDAFTTSPVAQALVLAPYGTATSILPGSSPPPSPTPAPTATPTSPSPQPTPAPGGVAALAVPATGDGALPGVLLSLAGLALAAAALRRRHSPAA